MFQMNLRISIFGVNFEVQNVLIFQGVGIISINDSQATIEDPHKPISVFNGSCPGIPGFDHCSGLRREMQVVMMGRFLGA